MNSYLYITIFVVTASTCGTMYGAYTQHKCEPSCRNWARSLVADTSRRHMPMLGAQGRLEDISGRLQLTFVGRSTDAAHAIDLQIMATQ